MTGTPTTTDVTPPPDAALVHLSGRRRGTTEFLSGDRVVIASAPDGRIVLTTSADSLPDSLATLERRGHTFALTTSAGAEVEILGYPTGIRARIARSQREILPVLEARGETDFWELAQILADGNHIAPLATRGIVVRRLVGDTERIECTGDICRFRSNSTSDRPMSGEGISENRAGSP